MTPAEMNRPVFAEMPAAVGEHAEVACVCGAYFYLWWNGGELDSRTCTCGRIYSLEHRQVVITMRGPQ